MTNSRSDDLSTALAKQSSRAEHDPIDFAIHEILEAHRIMDVAGVPRQTYEEALSLSQRVKWLASGAASA